MTQLNNFATFGGEAAQNITPRFDCQYVRCAVCVCLLKAIRSLFFYFTETNREKMYRIRRSAITIGRCTTASVRRVCSKRPPELPEEPTTCCMSGCANCVWIEYAERMKRALADSDSERVARMVMDKIQDPNMKAFLAMEFKSRRF